MIKILGIKFDALILTRISPRRRVINVHIQYWEVLYLKEGETL